jgi:hypothetical protein
VSPVHTKPTADVTVSSAPAVPTQLKTVQPPPPPHGEKRAPAQPLLRFHTAAHDAPATWRVLALSAWAAICLFVGLVPAGRLAAGFLLQVPIFEWYAATTASIGMLGIALITSAFAAIHRARLPWLLMTIATLLLMANVAMVYVIPF